MGVIKINSAPTFAGAPCSERLTPREAEVMDLAYLPTRTIAEQLRISQATVKRHLQGAYTKLSAETRTQAALLWEQRKAA